MRRPLGFPEWILREVLRAIGARIPPRRPTGGWINSTLRSERQVAQAHAEVVACGLPPHGERAKNWDALSALTLALIRTSRDAAVLEVGAAPYSVILPWLYLFGYRDLRGIDLAFARPFRRGPIRYEPGDLTATRFGDGSFDLIMSLSVIEHGVDPEAYVREMSRLLRPSGLLITSTDYWQDPVDTGGQRAYGVPIKIFTRPEIEALLALARTHHLSATGAVALECDERVVRWRRFDLRYTFTCFALEKR